MKKADIFTVGAGSMEGFVVQLPKLLEDRTKISAPRLRLASSKFYHFTMAQKNKFHGAYHLGANLFLLSDF